MTTHLFLIPWMAFLSCITAASLTLAQENLPAIVKKIVPSVVVILSYDKEGKTTTKGSGFFINEKGDVITNWHVLQRASHAEVKTADGKVYPVKKVLAEAKEADLIRISVEIPRNVVHPLSVSASLPEVGERVIVVGSPLGLERTVSDGIVSAVRDTPELGKTIQITAPLSHGSSGSPVLNMEGEVIGVATFHMVEGQNLNFAIPGERVASLALGREQTLAEWKAGRTEEWHTSAEGLFSAGDYFFSNGNYEKALSYFEKAVKKNRRYARAYLQIGFCNSKLRRFNEAIEAYKQAIRIKPDYAGVHFSLGLAYLILRDSGSALNEYNILKDLDEDLAKSLFHHINEYQRTTKD